VHVVAEISLPFTSGDSGFVFGADNFADTEYAGKKINGAERSVSTAFVQRRHY